MRFWEATGEQSPAEAFIEQIYSEYPVSPFNPDQHAVLTGEGENQTIALFELEPSKSVRGAVEIHWIQAYPQRQGVGTAAIREIQAKARAAGIKMSLYPKPNGSVSQASLKRLYKRLGFSPIHKGAATMVWDPAVSEQVASKFSAYEIALMEGGSSLDDLDEDWRHVVTGLGAASMLAGGGTAAYDAYKAKQQPTQQPQAAHVQQVQTPQPKVQAPQAQPAVSQTQAVSHAQDLLATKGAQILQKAAKAAGLKGNELAQFMAQCAHETANFTTLKELGDKNYFKKYDIKFAPAKAKELGNLRPGDGDLYKGRGFIQLTGRYNYKKAGEALGLPLEKNPQLVERPDVAAKVALWFWKNRVQPQVDNFSNTQDATKPINPGLKGLADRHTKFVGMKVATAKPQPKVAPAAAKPVKVAQKPAPVKGKKV